MTSKTTLKMISLTMRMRKNKKRLYEKKAPAWHVGAFYRRKGFGILKCRIGEEHEKRTSM